MDETLLTSRFIGLSRFAGSRFDLVQASGGNCSVKLDHRRMLVKGSGFLLSEVEEGKGYAVIDFLDIRSLFENPTQWRDTDKHHRDAKVNRLVEMATQPYGVRASIEVFLHAVLGRFVLHTHPIAVNIIGSQNDWEKNFIAIASDALCVPYKTPGIELGLDLHTLLQEPSSYHDHSVPSITFLQNHGLIVSGKTADEVQDITEEVARKCGEWCQVDLGRYQIVSAIEKYFGDDSIAYLCEDRVIMDLLKTKPGIFTLPPFCPDSFVFCGVVPLFLKNLDDAKALNDYQIAYQEFPKVIIFNGSIYFLGRNVKKAKETEEVFKAHLLTLASARGEINYLTQNELAYLGNWEAEQYRRNK